MIRVLFDRWHNANKRYIHAAGLSTDTKPTENIITGSRFVEVDTGADYIFDESTQSWHQNNSIPEVEE